MALSVFQGVAKSSCFAPLSLKGEGLGKRGKSHLPQPLLIGGE